MNKYAVLIGINEYHESLGKLKYSVNDCQRLSDVLTTGTDAFSKDNVLVLSDNESPDHKPTYANIHSWLSSWLAQPKEEDTVLVFFAGHGREMNGKCYLVPTDATLQTLHVTGIPVPYIQELLNRCKARQKVLILDACHSGAGRDVSTMADPMLKTLSAGKGIYTLTSCDVNELSHEWDEKKQGVFSYYLAEALSGSCPADKGNQLTIDTVYEWMYEKVCSWAARNRCEQNPKRLCDGIGSFTIKSFIEPQLSKGKEEAQLEKLSAKKSKVKAPDFEQEISSRNLPKWSFWGGKIDFPDNLWILAYCICGFLSILLAGVGIPEIAPEMSLESLMLGVCFLFAGIILIFSLQMTSVIARKNKWRLKCARILLEKEDYAAGLEYVLNISKLGVDKSQVAEIFLKLGNLAKSHNDLQTTIICWEKASKKWKSMSAKTALINYKSNDEQKKKSIEKQKTCDKQSKIDELKNQLKASHKTLTHSLLYSFLFIISIAITAFSIFVVSIGVSLLWIIGIVLGGISILCLTILFTFFGYHYIPTLRKHMSVKKKLRTLKYGNIMAFFIWLFRIAFICCGIAALSCGGFYISKQLVHHFDNVVIKKLESSAQNKVKKTVTVHRV